MNHRRLLTRALWLFLGVFALIQVIPYRVANPPVLEEPNWDRPQTEQLARAACFDCHSNEVVTPWYGQVAPVAWLVRHHVDEGRAALNFSEMNRPQEEAHEAAEETTEGEMPPLYYRLAHPSARLNEGDRRRLAAGLKATLESGDEHGGGQADSDSD